MVNSHKFLFSILQYSKMKILRSAILFEESKNTSVVVPNSRTAITAIFIGLETSVAIVRFDELCDKSCKTCGVNLLDPNDCLSCNNGYYMDGTRCSPCSSRCATCVDTADKCTACPEGANFKNFDPNTNFCDCPIGQFSDSLVCKDCQPPCNTC